MTIFESFSDKPPGDLYRQAREQQMENDRRALAAAIAHLHYVAHNPIATKTQHGIIDRLQKIVDGAWLDV